MILQFRQWLEIPLLGVLYYILELRFPLRNQVKLISRDEFSQDIIWLYFNELVTPYFVRVATLGISYLFWKIVRFKLNLEMPNLSPMFALVILFLWRDFSFWLCHYCAHKIKFLWRFHELHHSSTKLDWLSGFRGYWLDNLFFDTVTGLVFFFINLAPEYMIYWGYFELNLTFFIHTNTKFNLGFLGKWINNSYVHHWHHSKESIFEGGQNFGAYTCFWDHVFGTFYLPPDFELPKEYGLANCHNYPKSFIKRFFRPFR